MDIHSVPGVKARDVAEAHRLDLLHQQEYGCNCMTYWIDEARESIFCLIDAADKDAVKEMHRNAHGLVPHKIIEVSSAVVQSFLGRIYDPDDAVQQDGLTVFNDPSYRLLLLTKTNDHALLRHCLGREKAMDLLSGLNALVRRTIQVHDGSEAEHEGEGFVVSFKSANAAVECALAIQQNLPSEEVSALEFRMSLNGGEPIEKSNILFGDTIQNGHYLNSFTNPGKIALAGKIRDLVSKELLQQKKDHFMVLSVPDEDLALSLFTQLENNYHKPDFDVVEYAQSLGMSQPQFYRKTIALTGESGNALLKNFRLNKARELLKTQRYSISQVTYDTGFTSPSYFTKCFKAGFGLLPGEYLELLKN